MEQHKHHHHGVDGHAHEHEPDVALPPNQVLAKTSLEENSPNSDRLVGSLEWSLPFAKIGAGVLQCAAGVAQKAPAAIWDSLHGVGDFFGFIKKLQLISLRNGENQQQVIPESRFALWGRFRNWVTNTEGLDEDKLEKSSNMWTALPALGAVALAGANIVSEATGESGDNHGFDIWDAAHLGTAGAAFAVALGIWRLGTNMKRKVDEIENPHPLLKEIVEKFRHHGSLDTASSGVALFEAGIHSSVDWPPALIALNGAIIAIAGKQFWDFRWWKKDTKGTIKVDTQPESHNHHDHHSEGHDHDDHSHGDDCNHAHLVPHEVLDVAGRVKKVAKELGATAIVRWRERKEQRQQKEKPELPPSKKSRTRKLAAGLAAVAMVGGLASGSVGGGAEQDAPAESAVTFDDAPTLSHDDIIPPDPPKAEQAEVFECEVAEAGDSQWSIAADQAQKALGSEVTEQDIYSITLLSAHNNLQTAPDSDQINEGKCIDTLTAAAINELVTNQEITNHLDGLLDLGFDQALKQVETLDKINAELQQVTA